jgi:TonB family protein
MRFTPAARHAGVAGLLLLCAGAGLHAQDITPPRLADPAAVQRELTQRYPAHFARARVGGTVALRAFITAAGRADSIHITSRSGVSLDGRAVGVLRGARFVPAESAGAPVGAWAEFSLQFGDPWTDVAPAAVEPAAVEAWAQAHYPARRRGDGLQQSVITFVKIDVGGNVIEEWLPMEACFPEYGEAARTIARGLRFTPDPDAAERLTAVSVSFTGDSVRLYIRGDSEPPPQPRQRLTTAPPAPAQRTTRPVLSNQAAVQKALVDRVPPALQAAAIPGDVTVWLYVDERGRVARRRVAESTDNCDFERAAMDVARIMRFSPARRDGKPEAVWVEIPVHFFHPHWSAAPDRR